MVVSEPCTWVDALIRLYNETGLIRFGGTAFVLIGLGVLVYHRGWPWPLGQRGPRSGLPK